MMESKENEIPIKTKRDSETFQKKVAKDPVWFNEEVLGPKLWEKEKEIVLSVRDHKITAVRSCNTSGKSFTAGRIVNQFLLAYRNSLVITTAPTWRQVKEILWRQIRSSVEGKGIYPPNAVLETMIKLGNEWFALGLSTNKPDQFQGFHSEHLLAVIDEATGVDDVIFEAIDGLTPFRILMIGNPLRNTGRFASAFKDPNVHKIHISAFDTPNLIASGIRSFEEFIEKGDVAENKIVIPGLITLDDVRGFIAKYGIDSNVVRARVGGSFPTAEAESYIGLDEVEAALNRDPKEKRHTEKIMGVDTARFGDDRTVLQIRQGDDYSTKVVLIKKDAPEIAGQIIKLARKEKLRRPENIKIDIIGTNGLSTVHLLKKEGWDVTEVNFAEAALNPDPSAKEQFGNLRAECYDHVKTSLRKGSLPRGDEDYWELANIRYFYNRHGQVLLEKKEDMKKRGLLSPDVGDACAIGWAPIKKRRKRTIEPIGGGVKPFYPEYPNL